MDLKATYARIGQYIQSRPGQTYEQIAATLALSRGTVARIARLQGITRRAGKRAAALEAAVAAIEAASPKPDCALPDMAAPPADEHIDAAPDAPPVEDALSVTADTPSPETAAV
jgi:hypothetical protein